MNPPLQFALVPNHSVGCFNYDLYAHIRTPDGRVAIPEHSVTFRTMTIEEASAIRSEPLLQLPKESLQSLMDELWHLGIRPTEGHGSTGQLAATEKHLAHTTQLLTDTLQTVLNVANASLITQHGIKPTAP